MTLLIITLLLAAIQLAIQAAFIAALLQFVSLALIAIEGAICEFADWMAQLFEIVAGVRTISYKGDETLFMNVFFSNDTIATIYWGMALIGIALAIGIAIYSVVKRMFDAHDKHKTTMAHILGCLLKAILIIVSMNAIISAVLLGTNVLLDQMNGLFLHAGDIEFTYTIYFDEEDYGAMARCYDTIAEYSLNPTYNSRYNINACFNAIRKDLLILQNKDRFQYDIYTVDADGNEYETWQSVLQDIVMSQDLSEDVPIDDYTEARYDAIMHAMDILKTDSTSFKPLESYTVTKKSSSTTQFYEVGRMIMMLGGIDCAYNGYYNENPSLDDGLRKPYITGEKNAYKVDDLIKDFWLDIFNWNHIPVIVFAWLFVKNYLSMVFNAVSRVFNLLFLYLMSPPFIAYMPLDDGGKAKQWTKSFIIQNFALFGNLLSLRLYMIFMPIIISSDLKFFDNASNNFWAKMLVLLGLTYTVKKAGGIITGILADNAGMAAIQAGDMSAEAENAANTFKKYAMKAAKFVGGAMMGSLMKNAKASDKAKKENPFGARAGAGGVGAGVKAGLKGMIGMK